MNIIKLKDVVKPGDDFFNNYLKGRYAYWIQMRYIVSFDHMQYQGYVACEMDINELLLKEDGTYPSPYGCPYIDTKNDQNIYEYIDMDETDKINSISDFAIKNNYVTDPDITIDELKKFRTWLATQLLKFDQNNLGQQLYIRYDNNTTLMLEYYKNGMIDNTVEVLTDMSTYNKPIQSDNTECCCCNTSITDTNNVLYNINNMLCDPVAIYKSYIYNKMVSTFSNMDFWLQFPVEFISEMKKYIDNIIKMDFKLYKNGICVDIEDCGGLSKNDNIQLKYKQILSNLSESLQYIIDSDLNNHKNFIGDSLYSWSSLVYENMEW